MVCYIRSGLVMNMDICLGGLISWVIRRKDIEYQLRGVNNLDTLMWELVTFGL